MAKNTTTHTHNTFSCTVKFNDNNRRKTTKVQSLEQQWTRLTTDRST